LQITPNDIDFSPRYLNDFVRFKISDFGIKILQGITEDFKVEDLIHVTGWSPSITQRFINALLECSVLSKVSTSCSQYMYRQTKKSPKVPNQDLITFLDSRKALQEDLDNLLSCLKAYCEKFHGANNWWDREKDSFEVLRNWSAFLFYKYVVQFFLTHDSLSLALSRGKSVADTVFQIEDTKHFARYDMLEPIMKLHAICFALNYPIRLINSNNIFSMTGHEKVLDLGSGVGQLVLFNLQHIHNDIELHLLDHPSSMEPLRRLRSMFWHNQSDRVNWHFIDFFELSSENFVEGLHFDTIILSWILHDWDDENCHLILKKISPLLSPTSKIVVFENPLKEESVSGSFYDIMMLCLTGGRERTVKEYDLLFKEIEYYRVVVSESDIINKPCLVYKSI
jgi:ubiquinone/menaquinone biosynthesis C-methylase UbiE